MDHQKPISIHDVARMAGVSIATVSRVVNGNGRFSEATRERVQRIIDETGYVANMAARSLRQDRSKTIGMIVPDISNDFFSTLALHTEQTLAEHDYSVFVCNNQNSDERERSYIRTLLSKRVDGILCISGMHALAEGLIPARVPVVCVDRHPKDAERIPRVISRDADGGRLATEHLIERGCRRILFISSLITDVNKKNRELGYRGALEAHGLPVDPAYVMRASGERPSMIETEQLVGAFLASGRPLDGIFAASDHSAVGALRGLRSAGARVPEDIRIVGFDDSVYARITTPAITSIRRFPERLAKQGCEVMLNLIEGREAPLETVIPVELVERASTVVAR